MTWEDFKLLPKEEQARRMARDVEAIYRMEEEGEKADKEAQMGDDEDDMADADEEEEEEIAEEE